MADAGGRRARPGDARSAGLEHAGAGLYARLGFIVSAKRPRYYSKPEEDALILWKDSDI